MSVTAQKQAEKRVDGKISARRLNYLKYLLIYTNEPVESSAADCGWASPRDFAVVFQQNVGVTPTYYLNWHQG